MDALTESIFVQIADRIGTSWNEWLGQLIAYKEQFGNCNVSVLGRHSQLGRWVSNQRTFFKDGSLDLSRKARLEDVGFLWNLIEEGWEKQFEKLIDFKNSYGSCRVPRRYQKDQELANWVRTQRQNAKNNILGNEKIVRLDALGFEWEIAEAEWERNWNKTFADLVDFHQRFKHFNVPERWPEQPSLRGWISTQRADYKKGRLNATQIEKLETLGFNWAPMDETWCIRYEELKEFYKQRGHSDVRKIDNAELALWVKELRTHGRKRGMSKERLAQLSALKFEWNPHKADWDKRFEELCKYKAITGHCNVPAVWRENEKLGGWVAGQRKDKKDGDISDERVARLDGIGFSWDRFDEKWERSFSELKKYRNENGHCNVPQKCKDNPSLGIWVSAQRKKWRDKTIKVEQQKMLEALDFVWEPKKS